MRDKVLGEKQAGGHAVRPLRLLLMSHTSAKNYKTFLDISVFNALWKNHAVTKIFIVNTISV